MRQEQEKRDQMQRLLCQLSVQKSVFGKAVDI
jgi:hypothetical protein